MNKKTQKVVSKAAATVKKAAKKSKKQNINDEVKTDVSYQTSCSLSAHISLEDPGWQQYIDSLVKDINTKLESGEFSFYLAWQGFLDDKDLGFPDLYDRDNLFRILTTNGYCPECASNYITYYFLPETDQNGNKMHYCTIDRDENDFYWMEESFNQKLAEQARQLKSDAEQ